ncbi:TPA: hydroxymethylglutaryl-CoA reductase, degradative [Streptococcus suis]
MDRIEGFYRLDLDQRRALMEERMGQVTYPDLGPQIGDAMVENFLNYYQLPLGIATNLMVNGQTYQVPMVTEEPSVIAAASNGAKLLGNIRVEVDQRILIGQIVLDQVADLEGAKDKLQAAIPQLMDHAKVLTQSMVDRGGGPQGMWVEIKKNFLTLYVALDSQEAMGANAINQLLEDLTPYVSEITGGFALLRILSNYQDQALARAEASIPISRLSQDPDLAMQIAANIAAAAHYASLDPYRAVTHNKGIMNGIDAVLLATGNDWRAVNAGVHAFASRSGSYQPLSTWQVQGDDLVGQLTLPLAVATVGGTMKVHQQAQWSHRLLGNPNSQVLAGIIAALGLAQNFAALKALVTDGIQKGHMGLHARQLALQVGASPDEMPALVNALKTVPKMSQQVAEQILRDLRQK